MKVAVIAGGRFIAFDIARGLRRRDALAGLVTAYWGAFREGIPPRLLRWNPLHAVCERLALRRVHGAQRDAIDFDFALRFGKWAARRLPDADVVQAWTGYALESLVEGARRGATTVAFRASSHIETQAELLREEFRQFGWPEPAVFRPMVDREVEEYDTAAFVNVISTFAYRSFLARGFPKSRLILSPVAVDIAEVATPVARARRSGPLRVLFLGTVCLRKGVHYLIDAVRHFPPAAIELSLVGGIAADGREILRRKNAEQYWKGHVSRAELRALFARHDVLVLPSVEDGFGAVICEAMGAGLPVIASENSGGPDVVDDRIDGFIVPVRSAEAVRDALGALLEDPDWCAAMGERAARKMRERLTWDHFTDDLLAKYGRARRASRGMAIERV